MTTVRLPLEFEQRLETTAKTRHISKSDIIKEALENFFFKEETMDSYEIGKDYFGKYGSGNGKLSSSYKKLLKDKLHAKYHTH
jgi:predicted DNA-binding protein